MNKEQGSFFIVQQLYDGSDVLIGKKQPFKTNLSRQGWTELLNNNDWCIAFLREEADKFPTIVSNAVSKISKNKINL
ncbi:hypothetical protein BGW36DRAFT_439937 [Talaromyces proteolyticus]|uniref:Uncharacterized protein n=1 Tax=Talaromyces proteolyticus TaxID=1131652 RepID=A0AAD4PS94_9EURO|nr:uncharacterized protein BGW36DRAFT_439937 [Talaromyces proteolyticus]KAH8690682.1 hypothetical protein BGW36DRAFT_439937 [Talaromyces proteolyticus]